MTDGENEVGRDAQAGLEKPFTDGSLQETERSVGEQGCEAVGDRADTKDARAALRIGWERFGSFAKELPPLFKRHWQEIALNQDRVPLDPDWDRYYAYDLAGILRCLTARENGTLVGYVFILVYPHLHYASTCWGSSDIFWLDPAYRQGLVGFRLLRLAEQGAKEFGVKVMQFNTKLHFEASRGTIGKLLERMGYKPVEAVYSKFIG